MLLLVIFTLTFFMIRSLPGDPALVIAGEKANAAEVAKIREQLGLNQPLPIQYLREIKHVFVDLDFGVSHHSNHKISDELARKLPPTIELASLAMLIAVLFGIPLGMLAAKYRGRWIDVLLTQLSLLGVSIPVFLLGMILILCFEDVRSVGIAGQIGDDFFDKDVSFYFWGSLLQGRWDMFQDAAGHIVLPAVALATIPLSLIMRLTRSSVLEVLNEDFLRTARAKGVSEFKVYFKHILRASSTTLVTVIALQVGMLMSGAVLTETVFSWPGMGRYLIDAIEYRVYPAIQCSILLFTLIFIVAHFMVDVACLLLDPRLRVKA